MRDQIELSDLFAGYHDLFLSTLGFSVSDASGEAESILALGTVDFSPRASLVERRDGDVVFYVSVAVFFFFFIAANFFEGFVVPSFGVGS